MEFKGTKGKWDYKYINSDLRPTEWYSIQSDKGDVLRRDSNESDFKLKEMIANAILISKAPEMLEMLNEIYKLQCAGEANDKHVRKRVLELIKQATEL